MSRFLPFGKVLAVGLFSLSAIAVAAQASEQHAVVAPSCLLKNVKADYKTLAKKDSFSLIETDDAGIDALAEAKHKSKGCGGFMNVTHAWKADRVKAIAPAKLNQQLLQRYLPKANPSLKKSDPFKIRHTDTVNKLTSGLVPERMWSDLTHLTSYKDRYYRSDDGLAAATWIKTQVENMARAAGRDDITVHFVATGGAKQPSVVAKIGNSNEPGVLIGGHEDTLSSNWSNKPGADDDGSGTVTVLETARVLINSDVRFNKPIYLAWYAAEEVGLVGSQYVVRHFQDNKIKLDAVVQFDMTGYMHKNDPTMWLMDDYVDSDLTVFVEKLINKYVQQPVKHSRCGYACSDHASWTQGGYKSSMPFETAMNQDNPDIHSSRDTMEKLSLDHMTDYAKLAIAFAGELADPVK